MPPFDPGHATEASLSAGRELGRLALVFFARHWLVGVGNACVTLLVGLGLVWAASRLWPLRSYPAITLQLRRLVYIVALFKGAFYLTVGDSLIVDRGYPVGIGYQLAPPGLIDLFNWHAHFSIWHPTSATVTVTLVLCGLAMGLFILRAFRVAASGRTLDILDRIGGVSDPRVQAALQKAANVLRLPNRKLPGILLVEVDCATPLLLGVFRPKLVLSPRLAAMLTDEELEMALRHELAHVKRKDHWWRWIQLWIEDVGRPLLFTGRLGARSVETEELLCDRLAVKSPQDAVALARAITKAAGILNLREKSPDPTSGLPESVVPALLGRHRIAISEQASLNRRMSELLAVSRHISHGKSDLSKPCTALILRRLLLEAPALLMLGLILLGVLYARFHLILNYQ